MNLETKDLKTDVSLCSPRFGVNNYVHFQEILLKKPLASVCLVRVDMNKTEDEKKKRVQKIMDILQAGVDAMRAAKQKTRVLVEISGGVAQDVTVDGPGVEVIVADFDNLDDGDSFDAEGGGVQIEPDAMTAALDEIKEKYPEGHVDRKPHR